MRDFSISGEFRESTEVKSGNHARKFSGTQGMSEKDAYFIGRGGGGGGGGGERALENGRVTRERPSFFALDSIIFTYR